VLAAQASGAQVEPFCLTVYDNSNRVNIGHPATIGAMLRMAYIMAELGRFSA